LLPKNQIERAGVGDVERNQRRAYSPPAPGCQRATEATVQIAANYDWL